MPEPEPVNIDDLYELAHYFFVRIDYTKLYCVFTEDVMVNQMSPIVATLSTGVRVLPRRLYIYVVGSSTNLGVPCISDEHADYATASGLATVYRGSELPMSSVYAAAYEHARHVREGSYVTYTGIDENDDVMPKALQVAGITPYQWAVFLEAARQLKESEHASVSSGSDSTVD